MKVNRPVLFVCCLFMTFCVYGQNYNIRDYGAKGDGTTNDTETIQAAVRACHEDGGGTVLVPAGDYYSGTF